MTDGPKRLPHETRRPRVPAAAAPGRARPHDRMQLRPAAGSGIAPILPLPRGRGSSTPWLIFGVDRGAVCARSQGTSQGQRRKRRRAEGRTAISSPVPSNIMVNAGPASRCGKSGIWVRLIMPDLLRCRRCGFAGMRALSAARFLIVVHNRFGSCPSSSRARAAGVSERGLAQAPHRGRSKECSEAHSRGSYIGGDVVAKTVRRACRDCDDGRPSFPSRTSRASARSW